MGNGFGPMLAMAIDVGSTTTSAVAATAHLVEAFATGRVEIRGLEPHFCSPVVLTPRTSNGVDVEALLAYIDPWLERAAAGRGAIVCGGALITGLSARGPAAKELADALRQRLGQALIATASDPSLESWLAFMGNVSEASLAHPDRLFINLDIGGGTTNLALGRNGEVLATGHALIGARHFEVEPGTYRLRRLSSEAKLVLRCLGIGKREGDTLEASEVARVVDTYVGVLEAAITASRVQGSTTVSDSVCAALMPVLYPEPMALAVTESESEFESEPGPESEPQSEFAPIITFSGGVGELVYKAACGRALPSTTYYGDLGIDFASRIVASPTLVRSSNVTTLSAGGRALVFGLLRHATELSGSTIFVSDDEVLPLEDVPIVATLSLASSDDEIDTMVRLALRMAPAACIELSLPDTRLASVRTIGKRLAGAIRRAHWPPAQSLIVMVSQNVGKALGAYLTDWGADPLRLIVIDEVRRPGSHFVHVGRQRGQVVPVSFFGMR